MMKKLIEGVLPVDVISRDAGIEMSFKPTPSYLARCRELGLLAQGRTFYDPKIRSLLPWLARRSRSAARALNLAALLPAHTPPDQFLKMLGFSDAQLRELVTEGYPPLISYAQPAVNGLYTEGAVIMDPMGGGGSIPLEAAILGAQTIACDYNPVAFLILRATVEWPAQFGPDLYHQVRDEARRLIGFAREELARFYGEADRGYIIARQVLADSGVVPIASSVTLGKNVALLMGSGKLELSSSPPKSQTRRDLIDRWIEQHKALMQGHTDMLLTHRIVAVQERRGFRLARDEDQEFLRIALDELITSSPILPNAELPADNRLYRKVRALERYEFLFNPRQALVLGRLIEYVRNRVRILSQTDAEFGAAVATYLVFGLCRIADFNSILTSWNEYQGTVRDALGAYYKFRELRLDGIYAEAIVPYRTIEWVFEPDAERETAGGICPVLKELTIRLRGARSKARVFMADALQLSRHFQNVADVINVDPPYFDVHGYSDFSEFFWPILQTTLEDALPVLFGERVLFDWTPTMSTVPRQHEVIGRMATDEDEFEEKLARALAEMRTALKDDGLLVLWFSHKELKAWKAVAHALQRSGFAVVNVIPLVSEHPTRSITNGGKGGINRVLILVARKANGVSVDMNGLRERFLEQVVKARLFPHEQVSREESDFLVAAIDFLLNPNREV
jgi:adenine-specific DNA methylase